MGSSSPRTSTRWPGRRLDGRRRGGLVAGRTAAASTRLPPDRSLMTSSGALPGPSGLRRPARLVDIAEHAGVSTKTVSRVLNGEAYVREEMRQRVLASVQTLGYVGDAAAIGLRTRRSGFVGLVIPDVRNGFYALLTRAIEERLTPASPALLLGDSDEDVAQEERYLRLFRQQRVDGLIVLPAGAPSLADAVSEIPTVVLDRTVPAIRHRADHVMAANRKAAEVLVQHMVGHHRLERVAVVAGDRTISNIRDRQSGYTRVMRRAGCPPTSPTATPPPTTRPAGRTRCSRRCARHSGYSPPTTGCSGARWRRSSGSVCPSPRTWWSPPSTRSARPP